MAEKYVAVYRKGKGVCGAVRAYLADQIIEDLTIAIGGHFYYKPISQKRATEIKRAIADRPLSSGVEAILSQRKKVSGEESPWGMGQEGVGPR